MGLAGNDADTAEFLKEETKHLHHQRPARLLDILGVRCLAVCKTQQLHVEIRQLGLEHRSPERLHLREHVVSDRLRGGMLGQCEVDDGPQTVELLLQLLVQTFVRSLVRAILRVPHMVRLHGIEVILGVLDRGLLGSLECWRVCGVERRHHSCLHRISASACLVNLVTLNVFLPHHEVGDQL